MTAAALREPTLTPVSELDETRAAATERKDPDFKRMSDGQRIDTTPPARAKRKKGGGFFAVMLVALAATAVAMYYFKTQGLPSETKKVVAMVAPGTSLPGPLEVSIPASVMPSSSVTSTATALSPPPAKAAANTAAPSAPQNTVQSTAVTTVPVDTAQNFVSIKVVEARLDDLSKQIGTLAVDIKTLIAGHAQSKEQLAQLSERARIAPAPVVAAARPAPPRYQVARAAPPKPAQAATVNAAVGSTNVVSVDLWNGTPSVVISEGENIRFMAPGDVTPQGLTVKTADPVSQQVTFGMPSGEEVIARVDARQ